MKETIAILLTIAVGAYFWIAWIDDLQEFARDVKAIKMTLEDRNYTNVRVYPLTPGCYSYVAIEDYKKSVNGKICLEELK